MQQMAITQAAMNKLLAANNRNYVNPEGNSDDNDMRPTLSVVSRALTDRSARTEKSRYATVPVGAGGSPLHDNSGGFHAGAPSRTKSITHSGGPDTVSTVFPTRNPSGNLLAGETFALGSPKF